MLNPIQMSWDPVLQMVIHVHVFTNFSVVGDDVYCELSAWYFVRALKQNPFFTNTIPKKNLRQNSVHRDYLHCPGMFLNLLEVEAFHFILCYIVLKLKIYFALPCTVEGFSAS